MKPSDITTTFVQQRAETLKAKWGERNERMNEYERIYLMDLWDDAAEPDERRLVAPIAWTRVESYKALLLTKPPVISVPASDIKAVAEDQADLIEKFLYGAWYQANVLDALADAEWFASCFGEGVIRCLYDDNAADGDLPLLIQGNVDPRNVYALPSSRPERDAELVHSWKRARREIEEEWGTLPGHPDGIKEAEWLDVEIDFADYWRVDIVEESVKEKVPQSEEPGVEGLVATAEGQKPKRAKFRTVKRRVRAVTNAVAAGDDFLKKPVRMPGYSRIPFIRYAGISTPLKDENGALSVLFPITAGSQIGSGDVKGVCAAMSELLGYRQRIVEMYANAAVVVTGAEKDIELDFSPAAQNSLPAGAKIDFLVPPGPHPAVDGQLQILEREIEDATVSAGMMGRYQGDVSGLALSAMANPILMRIAHRQRTREHSYQALNELILELAEFYSGPDGWSVWGQTDAGAIDLVIKPEDIGGYHRNLVKLSASLPKDANGEVMMMANLVSQNLISHETFLDCLQQAKGLINQSPLDEIKAVLRDKMLFSSKASEIVANIIVTQYSKELADALGIQLPGQEPKLLPQNQPPMPPVPGLPSGPMQGIPPGVVAPQQIPEMIGAQNLPGMLRMQGQPLPSAPPIPGPGGV